MIGPRQEIPEPIKDRPKLTAGQAFVKKIRPAGCVLFLMLFVLVTAVCLTAGRSPVKGYSAQHDTAYYEQDPEALAAELEDNLFPALPDYEMSAAVNADGTVTVTIDDDHFAVGRSAVLRYYDESLIVFERG